MVCFFHLCRFLTLRKKFMLKCYRRSAIAGEVSYFVGLSITRYVVPNLSLPFDSIEGVSEELDLYVMLMKVSY